MTHHGSCCKGALVGTLGERPTVLEQRSTDGNQR